MPPTFAGDLPGASSVTPTNDAPTEVEIKERVGRRHVFHPGEPAYAVANCFGANRELARRLRFLRPDGTQHFAFTANPVAADFDKGFLWAFTNLPAGGPTGECSVAFDLGGVERGRATFAVAPRPDLLG